MPATYYLLSIRHDHGTNNYLHRSPEEATAALHAYVKEWWASEVLCEVHDREIPADADAAIEEYFEHAPGEDYEIEPINAPTFGTHLCVLHGGIEAGRVERFETAEEARAALVALALDPEEDLPLLLSETDEGNLTVELATIDEMRGENCR